MPSIVYENGWFYCAIEKCAITRLIGYFGTSYLQEGNTRRDKAEQIFYPAKEVFSSDIPSSIVKKRYPGFRMFTFVRNPFDRVASNYHFNKGRWAKRAKTAGTNVDHVPTFTEYCVDMNKWNRLEPMMFHLDALDDRDFVGKIENFKEDFDKLHRWLNTGVMCDPDGNHPLDRVENRSNRKKDYRIYYDDTARKVIEERFAADLERFDYTF